MSVLLNRYIAFMLRHRWPVLTFSAAVAVALTAGLPFIIVSNDWRDSFDKNNPQLVAFEKLEKTYSVTHSALIALAPKDGSVFTREILGAIEELTEAAWKVPWSNRVDSLATYNHSQAEGNDLIVERLVDNAESLSDEDLARIKRIALSEPSVAGRLVSRDGRIAGLAISFTLPENSNTAVRRITDYVRDLLDKARADHPDIAYYLTGDVFVSRVMTEAVEDDMRILAPAAFLVIVATAAILLRSLLGMLAIVVVLISVIGSTMGVVGWTGLVLNAANSSVPIIVMSIAIADSVHIIEMVMSGMRKGLERDTAIVESLARKLLAGVPDVGYDGHRFSQPERLGLTAFSGSRKSRGVRHGGRLLVFHDASAGATVGPAVARAYRTPGAFRFLRSLGRLRYRALPAPALGHGRRGGRRGDRRAPRGADGQLVTVPG